MAAATVLALDKQCLKRTKLIMTYEIEKVNRQKRFLKSMKSKDLISAEN